MTIDLQALLPAQINNTGSEVSQAYSRLCVQSAVAIGFGVVILRV